MRETTGFVVLTVAWVLRHLGRLHLIRTDPLAATAEAAVVVRVVPSLYFYAGWLFGLLPPPGAATQPRHSRDAVPCA